MPCAWPGPPGRPCFAITRGVYAPGAPSHRKLRRPPSVRSINALRMRSVISASPEVTRKHSLSAASFAEYGLSGTESAAALAVTIEPLVTAAHSAWPFVSRLHGARKPSLGAYEAIHPVACRGPRLDADPRLARAVIARSRRVRTVAPGVRPGRAPCRCIEYGQRPDLSPRSRPRRRTPTFASAGPTTEMAARSRSVWSADHDVLEVTSTEAEGTAHANAARSGGAARSTARLR